MPVLTLLELQRATRASLVGQDDLGLLESIVANGLEPAQRLNIYRNTFASVLVSALGLSYPAVRKLVGPEFFEAAARLFIGAHLPSEACLDRYGAGFADFLAAFPPAASLPYLPGVAALEFAVSRALHARDAASIDLARLAALSDVDRARVAFSPHPSIGLVRSPYPIDSIWRAVVEEDEAALSSLDIGSGPVWLLVERDGVGVQTSRLTEAQWRITADLCAGLPLSALAADCKSDFPELLATHLSSGRLVDFSVAHRHEDAGCAADPFP